MTPTIPFASRAQRFIIHHKWPIAAAVIIAGVLTAGAIYVWGFEVTKPSSGTGNEVDASKFGAAFGGIAGTTITILGIAFLAYAYLGQRQQAETGLFNKLYEDLLNDINSIQYRKTYRDPVSSPNDSELLQGVDALFGYEFDKKNQNSVLNHVNLILISFNHLIDLIDSSAYYDSAFKNIMLDKIYLLFLAKIYWPCYTSFRKHRNSLLAEKWGYPQSLFYNFDKLRKQSHLYLFTRRHIAFGPKDYVSDGKLTVAAELESLLQQKTEDEPWEELRGLLNREFKSMPEYWKTYPAESPNVPIQTLPKSHLFSFIRKHLKHSQLTDAIIEELGQGRTQKAREFFNWIKTAYHTPSKYIDYSEPESSNDQPAPPLKE